MTPEPIGFWFVALITHALQRLPFSRYSYFGEKLPPPSALSTSLKSLNYHHQQVLANKCNSVANRVWTTHWQSYVPSQHCYLWVGASCSRNVFTWRFFCICCLQVAPHSTKVCTSGLAQSMSGCNSQMFFYWNERGVMMPKTCFSPIFPSLTKLIA